SPRDPMIGKGDVTAVADEMDDQAAGEKHPKYLEVSNVAGSFVAPAHFLAPPHIHLEYSVDQVGITSDRVGENGFDVLNIATLLDQWKIGDVTEQAPDILLCC